LEGVCLNRKGFDIVGVGGSGGGERVQ